MHLGHQPAPLDRAKQQVGKVEHKSMDETVLRELSQSRSSSKKDLIFQHIVSESRDQSLLTAYKVKHDIMTMTSSSPSYIKIGSTDPLPILPEGKYTHCPGARMSSHTLTRSQTNVRFSLIELSTCTKSFQNLQLLALEGTGGKSPTRIKPSAVHLRLNSVDSWPETFKKRHSDGGQPTNTNVRGDLIDNRSVTGLLSGTSIDKLNIPGRAADYISEVQWRKQLRN